MVEDLNALFFLCIIVIVVKMNVLKQEVLFCVTRYFL
jgi:hypothetical protein